MRLSCKVIEDILPMYYDGVCSEESAALVEGHLKECPHCSHILSELRSDITIPEKNVDDIKPLKKIQKSYKKMRMNRILPGKGILRGQVLSILDGTYVFRYNKTILFIIIQ